MTATRNGSRAEFAIRTSDEAWIKRNHGVTGNDGRVTILVPASEIEVITFCGNDHLRHYLADCPKDFGNPWAMCPAVWVPETAALIGASTRLTPETIARQAETARWKARAGAGLRS